MRVLKSVVATSLAIGLAGSVVANDVKLSDNAIQMKSSLYGDSVKMTITGPDKFRYTSEKAGGNALLSLDEVNARKDGLYKYEFVEIKTLGEEDVVDEFNGRGKTKRKIVESKKVSGHFRISNGVLVSKNKLEKTNITINPRTLNSEN
ncbi:hypothetical protein [Aliikangiella coralliicola]|uniref:Uncharacterized protein n=1 Tax=Aliikangiella coralliicola TaxID=2592383 RepID=A0A545TSM6_9GAMM|nr:hypothetical protein [Aliikangiella coralliicola]TQV80223.1 hypothetical protein FLL46_26250 [Aliikangiella coralliicola]